MEEINASLSEEDREIAREEKMAKSGNYEPVDLCFVDTLVAKSEKLRQDFEHEKAGRESIDLYSKAEAGVVSSS
ncbi:MAG: hypothetical protein AAF236_02130 [Verrucomicrobiota bacterium]